ncbi:MAG: hypothetical protein WD802_09130 [Gemmatimonadaceae bacterium]
MEKIKAEAIARARAQIAPRIARFCKELSQEEFEALLDRMAGIQYKYDCVDDIPPKPNRKSPPANRE